MNGERRKAARTPVSYPQQLQLGDDPVAVRIHVRNLSPDGLMLDSGLPLARGEQVQVALTRGQPQTARVVWKARGRYGLAFEEPVDALPAPRAIRMGRPA